MASTFPASGISAIRASVAPACMCCGSLSKQPLRQFGNDRISCKVLAVHFVQCCFNQIPVRFEQVYRKPGRFGFQALRPIHKHPRVIHRIFMRIGARNALAVNKSFFIKAKQGSANIGIKWFGRLQECNRMTLFKTFVRALRTA